MAATPEMSGQESAVEEVVEIGNVHPMSTLAAALDAPDDPNEKVVEDVKENVEEEVVSGEKEVPVVESGQAKEDEEVIAEVEGSKVETPPAPPTPDQTKIIQTLRQMRRDQALANARLQRQDEELQRLRTVKPVAPEDDPEDLLSVGLPKTKAPEKVEPVKLSEIEQLHQEIQQIGSQRGENLTTLVEVMAVQPAFKDVKEVCSRDNLNDLVDAMAEKISTEQGLDPVLAAMKVEAAIWKLPNPYSWMYETIKAHHPKYKVTETPPVKETPKKPAGREPKPAEAPPTVVDKGGSSAVSGGWTAASLDVMDDAAYAKVPQNIRELYLLGKLA